MLDVDTSKRFMLFPLEHEDLFDMYKQAIAAFWTVEEIDVTVDIQHWKEKLTEDERRFIRHILAFFAGADAVVMENLDMNFSGEVASAEARSFYAFQGAVEAIHNETYNVLIDSLVEDQETKHHLFEALESDPVVAQKAEYAKKYLSKDIPFVKRLIAFVIFEGVFFSSSFCSIFWMKKRGLMPGLGLANSFIARDENLHATFGVALYHKLQPNTKLSASEIKDMFRAAVEIEEIFVRDALPVRLVGINADSMITYVKFVADFWLRKFGVHEALYNVQNPFDWMEMQALAPKDNFFERRNTSYSKYSTMNDPVDDEINWSPFSASMSSDCRPETRFSNACEGNVDF